MIKQINNMYCIKYLWFLLCDKQCPTTASSVLLYWSPVGGIAGDVSVQSASSFFSGPLYHSDENPWNWQLQHLVPRCDSGAVLD